jgi:hypothetical protein
MGAPAARPINVVLAARNSSIIGKENVDRRGAGPGRKRSWVAFREVGRPLDVGRLPNVRGQLEDPSRGGGHSGASRGHVAGQPSDPSTFAFVAALLIVIALAACYVPARRALKADVAGLMR